MLQKNKNSILLLVVLLIELSSSNKIIEQLDGKTQPINYNLVLNIINLKSDSFSGIARIKVKCIETTQVIKLHSENLTITSVKLNRADVNSYSVDAGFLTIDLGLTQLIENLEYIFVIRYSGLINDNLTGLYKTNYLVNGEQRVVAATFFPPNFARTVFPCYDEPSYKSTFELVIQHASDYHVLANTEIYSRAETLEDEKVTRTEFVKTSIMSTYLLAFTITDFTVVQKNNSIVNVYVQPYKTTLVKLSLDFGGIALAKLEEYLDQKYQISKMDFILFDDFLYGAMENWGLITYRSSKLYFDSQMYSIHQYYEVLKIITHELAHQWFGNELTCSWWSHTWLNEGFATFMEDYIVQLIYPEMRNMDLFLIDTVQEALRQDVAIDIKPMNNIVNNTDQLSTIYDFIAYKKSGSVIRMIETFVTPNVFQQVVRNYIASNSYAAVSPFELYRSFDQIFHGKNNKEISVNITKLIRSWTDNPGYPILNVLSQFNNNTFEITQHRFLADGSIRESNFIIPTTYISNGTNTTESLVIHSSYNLDIVTENKANNWVLFNVDSNGYYRVNYDLRNWNLLISELSNFRKSGYVEQIKAVNRAQLIDDAFNLAKYNYLTYNVSIDLVGYIKNEIDVIPIKAAIKNLDFFYKIYRGNTNIEPIQEFIHDVIRPIFLKFYATRPSDTILRLTRMEIFNFACKVGLKECVKYIKTTLTSFVTKSVDADIRQGYFYGLARANPSYLVEYMGTLLATQQSRYDNFDELNEVINSLSYINEELVISVLTSVVDRNVFELTIAERQRILEVLIFGNDDNIEQILYFIRDNYSKLDEFNKSQLFIQISNNIVSAKSKTIFDDMINKITVQLNQVERDVLKIAQSSIEANLKWSENNVASIIERIQNRPEIDDSESEEITEPSVIESPDNGFPIHYVILAVVGLLVIIVLVFVLRKCCRK